MIQVTLDVRAVRRLLWLLVSVAIAVAALVTVRSAWAGVDDPPVPTVAFVARADNPVDALAAAGVAGQLGAPVYLTFPDELGEDAAGGLAATDPNVVVLAGGTTALSEQVHDQVTALLPDAHVVRKAGGTRTSTAVALNELPAELGFSRPVLAGATVPGDAGIAGELTVNGVQVAATLAELTARIDSLEDDLAAANGRIGNLEDTLVGVARDGDVLRFSGMNLQLVNGEGTTDTSNGLGNLIVGYNQQRPSPAVRAGSHYLVVGDQHEWTSYGGIVAGHSNTASGDWASVSGGRFNTASALYASVSGGVGNTASGVHASVTGGSSNTASGNGSSVSGGDANSASGFVGSSVSGGDSNSASGARASVSGGESNSASGNGASVSGGRFNTASSDGASVTGGDSNTAAAFASTVAGGRLGTISASPSSNSYDSRIGDNVLADG